tara:strand:+ start:88 stop:234 length:147 start_codon:yes stop_codon:yes gene_type:complete
VYIKALFVNLKISTYSEKSAELILFSGNQEVVLDIELLERKNNENLDL